MLNPEMPRWTALVSAENAGCTLFVPSMAIVSVLLSGIYNSMRWAAAAACVIAILLQQIQNYAGIVYRSDCNARKGCNCQRHGYGIWLSACCHRVCTQMVCLEQNGTWCVATCGHAL